MRRNIHKHKNIIYHENKHNIEKGVFVKGIFLEIRKIRNYEITLNAIDNLNFEKKRYMRMQGKIYNSTLLPTNGVRKFIDKQNQVLKRNTLILL